MDLSNIARNADHQALDVDPIAIGRPIVILEQRTCDAFRLNASVNNYGVFVIARSRDAMDHFIVSHLNHPSGDLAESRPGSDLSPDYHQRALSERHIAF